MVIIQRMVQCNLEIIRTLQVFEDITLEIIFLLERDEQDTGFQMSVDMNISVPLRAVKTGRMPSARTVHMTREARYIYSREQAGLSQNCPDFTKTAKTEKYSYAIGKLYFKIIED
jgi:hypothetical protein